MLLLSKDARKGRKDKTGEQEREKEEGKEDSKDVVQPDVLLKLSASIATVKRRNIVSAYSVQLSA